MKCYRCEDQSYGTYYRRGKKHLFCFICVRVADSIIGDVTDPIKIERLFKEQPWGNRRRNR